VADPPPKVTAVPDKPIERVHFANQLRKLRAERGYRTAKSFATALGIEENGYTRYERAEVEPCLTLIVEMCKLLKVKPNELLAYPTPALLPPIHPPSSQ
jgi:transcriptional regulator with XRE-family HTH domain